MNLTDYVNKAPLANAEALALINARKNGQILTLVYRSEKVSSNKTGNRKLRKYSAMQVQIGCDYYHTPEGMEALARNGHKSARNGLTEIEKDKLYVNADGDVYLSVFPLNNGYGNKLYVLDDVITTKEKLAESFPPSFYESHSDSGILTLKLSNIMYIA